MKIYSSVGAVHQYPIQYSSIYSNQYHKDYPSPGLHSRCQSLSSNESTTRPISLVVGAQRKHEAPNALTTHWNDRVLPSSRSGSVHSNSSQSTRKSSQRSSPCSVQVLTTHPSLSFSNSTWLIFMNEKWVPFDMPNQAKLEHTLSLGGTFIDITDSHFPNVKRVRVFPKNSYLSYLGVKYRLSRIMQPDAWLDHTPLQGDNLSKGMSDPKLWEITHSFKSLLATL